MRSEKEIENELIKPLDASKVKTRAGRGGSGDLSYLSQDEVKREMNAIFGRLGWSSVTEECKVISEANHQTNRGEVFEAIAQARVRVNVSSEEYVGSCSVGTGVGNGTSAVGKSRMDAYELAIKEAESDAFKRACVKFGDRLGLALYDKAQARVRQAGSAPAPDLSNVNDLDTLNQVWQSLKPEERKPYTDMFAETRARIVAKEGS